ncbi:MAG: DUF1499 domain-containing protein [Alphaproteobacteria bacterium]|jgi:hypothetical protein|nr:DUF1499 domain-containing protein [Alphaproteobacteria bacterium]MBN9557712.1 DUF1499 domain-containing protein [Alphaproteobacteria bacterium]MBN9567946.1 DUF1499 domain-containing protein [Alphaproteobacteria bacterium]MBN9592518.1 DUF1499 domain-containing protein [Alphaproteobacteria bacterium]
MRALPVLAKLAFATFAISALIGGGAALGTRIGVFDYQLGLLKIFPWCVFTGLGALALSILWALSALIRNYGTGALYGVIALVGSIAIVSGPLYTIFQARELPPIHDVSTDVMNAPAFEALLPVRVHADTPAAYDGPDKLVFRGKETSVAALQKKYYSDIHPIAILTKPDVLYWRGFEAAKRMGWQIIAFDPKRGRVEAVARSFWFGLPHDVVIRVQPSGLGARLDIRSKSRFGNEDFGSNANLIRAYVKTLARR